MPPKKDPAASTDSALLIGFLDKETKLIAAAFLSCVGPDKYDYDLMSALTGNTNLSLKKMWPPVKKKAIDAHPSFGTFLSLASSGAGTGDAATAKPAAAPKAAAGRKRKAADDVKDQAAADAEDVKNQAATDAEAIKKQAATDAAKIKGEVNSDDDDVPASKSASPVKKKAPAARKPRAKKPKKEEVHEEDVEAPGLGEDMEVEDKI